jgi:hypothetical protein
MQRNMTSFCDLFRRQLIFELLDKVAKVFHSSERFDHNEEMREIAMADDLLCGGGRALAAGFCLRAR